MERTLAGARPGGLFQTRMSPDPALSIVIPTLNAAAHLRGALESIDCTNVPVETVLVDGGSTDGTLAIAASQPQLRAIVAPGTSIYEALNRGIVETRAPAIVFLNADDILLPGALDLWHETLVRAPVCGIARGRATFVEVNEAGEVLPWRQAASQATAPLTVELMLRGPCTINSLCIRRSVFDRIGTFDTAYRFAADRDWMFRAHRAGIGMTEIDRPVYRYLSHPQSSTMDRGRRNYARIRREHIDIAARSLRSIDETDAKLARMVRRWHAAEAAMLCWHSAKTCEFRALAAVLVETIGRDAWWPFLLSGDIVDRLMRRQMGISIG